MAYLTEDRLPPLPDFIVEMMGGERFAEVGHELGFHDLNSWMQSSEPDSRVQDDGTTAPQTFLPLELKKEILAGNFQALANARRTNESDIQPNLTTIKDSKDILNGFVETAPTATQPGYHIVASNNGWIWTYTTQIRAANTSAGEEPKSQCVVQVGSYSKSSKILGISYQTFTSIGAQITAVGISGYCALVFGHWFKNMLLDRLYIAAIRAAVADAGAAALKAGFIATVSDGAILGTYVMATLGSALVGAIVALAIFYICDFLHRSYGLTINIYNWDSASTWNIANWYGDNAVVSQEANGSGPWRSASLLPVQKSVPGPVAPIPTINSISQYASYAYRNDSQWAQGLGVAMLVTSSNASFYLKYIVKRFSSNLIGISSNTNQSIKAFYDDPNSWRPSGEQSYSGKIDGRPDLTTNIITTSLNSDRAYNFEVHIGLKESVAKST